MCNIHVHMCVRARLRVHVSVYVCMHARCVCVYTYTYIHVSVYVCMHANVYVRICIYEKVQSMECAYKARTKGHWCLWLHTLFSPGGASSAESATCEAGGRRQGLHLLQGP